MKKSFVLYSDMHSFVKAMTNEQAGEFVKLVYAYACDDVIDESTDPLVVATFNHVKLKLDECAEKYEEKRRKARESARKRWDNNAQSEDANACERIKPQCDTMLNVTVTDTVTVTDKEKINKKEKSVLTSDDLKPRTSDTVPVRHFGNNFIEFRDNLPDNFKEVMRKVWGTDQIGGMTALENFYNYNAMKGGRFTPAYWCKLFKTYMYNEK